MWMERSVFVEKATGAPTARMFARAELFYRVTVMVNAVGKLVRVNATITGWETSSVRHVPKVGMETIAR